MHCVCDDDIVLTLFFFMWLICFCLLQDQTLQWQQEVQLRAMLVSVGDDDNSVLSSNQYRAGDIMAQTAVQ